MVTVTYQASDEGRVLHRRTQVYPTRKSAWDAINQQIDAITATLSDTDEVAMVVDSNELELATPDGVSHMFAIVEKQEARP